MTEQDTSETKENRSSTRLCQKWDLSSKPPAISRKVLKSPSDPIWSEEAFTNKWCFRSRPNDPTLQKHNAICHNVNILMNNLTSARGGPSLCNHPTQIVEAKFQSLPYCDSPHGADAHAAEQDHPPHLGKVDYALCARVSEGRILSAKSSWLSK